MKRKEFIKLSGLSLASLFAGNRRTPGFAEANSVIYPPKLKKGDVVGLVAPGSYITEKELEDAKRNLTALGLKPYYTKSILAKDGYLAGSDQTRAEDLNAMFKNDDIKAVWAVRGGYGCARILGMIDYESIKKNPKILIGYSDITALLYAVFAKTGLISFHGPVGISTFDEFSVSNLSPLLFGNSKGAVLKPYNDDEIITIRSGKAAGRLIGGNLSLVVSMIGTEYDVNSNGKIIFIEEINEEPYRIDRMLTQMIEAGKFKGARAVALGNFRKCEVKEDNPEFDSSFTLKEVLFDRLFGLEIPVVYGLSFGHIANKITLPFGAKAELNVNERTIALLENTVV